MYSWCYRLLTYVSLCLYSLGNVGEMEKSCLEKKKKVLSVPDRSLSKGPVTVIIAYIFVSKCNLIIATILKALHVFSHVL